jgi:hypothetical protein
MLFFQDFGGSLIPVADIERVYREDQDKERIYWAALRDGNTHRLMPGEYENIRRAGCQFFAAEPGHFVLDIDFDPSTKNDPVIRTPIIGWCVCPDQGTIPVTLDGPNDGKSFSATVLFPSGHVHVQETQIFESLEQFIESSKPEGSDK